MPDAVLIQTAENGALLDITHERHQAWCDRYGAAFWSIRGRVQARGGVCWDKLVLILMALEAYEYVFYIDADTLIANSDDFRSKFEPGEWFKLAVEPCQPGFHGHDFAWQTGLMLFRGERAAPFLERALQRGAEPNLQRPELGDMAAINCLYWEERTWRTGWGALSNRYNAHAHQTCCGPAVMSWRGDGPQEARAAYMRRALGALPSIEFGHPADTYFSPVSCLSCDMERNCVRSCS